MVSSLQVDVLASIVLFAMNEVLKVASMDRYDVLVAGGGVAGIAAACSAARSGAKTLLIERYGFLGGMATAGLVNPFMNYFTSTGKQLVGGFFDEICERMREQGGMLDRAFDPEAMKFAAQEMVLESGCDLMLHSMIVGARMDGRTAVGVEVVTKSGMETVDAACLVDATGDADLAAMTGADYEEGDPDTGFTQAMTTMFIVGGVDIKRSLLYAVDNPEQMRFPKPQSEDAVERMLQGVVSIAGFFKEVENARLAGEFSLPQDMIFFISLPTPGQVVVNTTHVGGLSGTEHKELTRAEVEGRRQVISLMRFMRKYIPGFENSYLVQTAAQIGVRETRRIVGDYIFGKDDVIHGVKFPDVVLRSAYPVDVHSSVGKGYSKDEADDGVPGIPPPGDWYEVPYRCLLPKHVDNLLVAGRCISATHEGQGALRIMPNCFALGQAAGTAAALSAANGVTPRKLDRGLLRRKLLEGGAVI